MPNDEYLIVKLDGRPRLVIAIDPLETDRPPSGGTGVFNVRSAPYSAQPSTSAYSLLGVLAPVHVVVRPLAGVAQHGPRLQVEG